MAIRKILFVEKRKDLLRALQILLKNRGIEMVTAATPVEASSHPATMDALVVAAADPDCEHTQALLASYKRQSKPSIAITSFAMPHNIDELRATGFDEVLAEPVNLDRLIRALQKFEPN